MKTSRHLQLSPVRLQKTKKLNTTTAKYNAVFESQFLEYVDSIQQAAQGEASP
jgi:hypothetical protein